MIATAALIAATGLLSCRKDQRHEELEAARESREMALLTVNIKGNFANTKATPDVGTHNNEDMLSSVEVFVFDARSGSVGLGLLEAYKKAEASEMIGTNQAKLEFNTSTGAKHIYVVANAGRNAAEATSPQLGASIGTEAALKAAISEFSDNAQQHFLMVGAASKELAAGNAGVNNVNIEAKRLVSRIKIESVTGAFTSPALQQSDFKVTRVYLMNVPRQAKYVNGDANDVFGVAGATALSTTDSGYPARFVASASLPYYAFATPAASASAPNGMYAWMAKEGWSAAALNTLLNGLPETVKKLTYAETTAPNHLFVNPDSHAQMCPQHKWEAGLYFYAYPNSSVPAIAMDATDHTTKVVIETELTTGGNTITYYYPLSIPYIQPNYAYTIGDVKIKRLGSLDPFTPVSTAECTFTVKVRDWDAGDIIGEFNNETSGDDFEI